MKHKVLVEEAWDLIACAASQSHLNRVPLTQAVGCTLAVDICAPIALPPFSNSAVDGYALGSLQREYRVLSTIGAGEVFSDKLEAGQACRIMTGAQIPDGTCAIAMQEHVTVRSDCIVLSGDPKPGEHIRLAGEDVDRGALVLRAGTRIAPAHVGLLAALGIAHVHVRRPRMAIISTGNELVEPGEALGAGQVYYCTGPMLRALAESTGANVTSVQKISDDQDLIVAALERAREADIIVMIGGMAGGLFDFGRSAFESVGVEPVFFEGQWRPGKPLFFGTWNESIVFGLPGNPVAAFVMFKIFIEPVVTGVPHAWRKAPVRGAAPKVSDKTQFLRARLVDGELELVPGQGSHQLFNLALSNAVVWVPAGAASESEFAYLPLEA